MTDIQAEIDAVKKVIRRWARAFANKDLPAVFEAWDQDYPNIIYQAEEYPDPLRGWAEVDHYYRGIAKLAQNFRDQSVVDFDVDVIGDVAWCYLRGTTTFDILGSEQIVTGLVRQVFLLRKTAGGWKIIQYHDSREVPELREPLLAAHPRADAIRNS
jgi:ketosteroid isomerase-like protein